MADGIFTTAFTGYPSSIDRAALKDFSTSDGIALGDIFDAWDAAAAGFADFNWPRHPELAMLMKLTCTPDTRETVRWRIGNIAWQRLTSDALGQIQGQHRTIDGGQVPPYRYGARLGYTAEALRGRTDEFKAVSSADLMSDFGAMLDGLIEVMRVDWLKCIMYIGERAVPGSTTGVARGWVGGTNQAYVPDDHNGQTFSSDNHYDLQADTANGRRAGFENFRANLHEHGLRSQSGAPLLLLHGITNTRADVIADSKYVTGEAAYVIWGDDTARATAIGAGAHGVLTDSSAWCCEIAGIPDNYFGFVKSYGEFSPMNPIRLWYPANRGFGPYAVNIDPSPPTNVSPIESMEARAEFGFIITKPEHGAALRIAGSGSYGTGGEPTIT